METYLHFIEQENNIPFQKVTSIRHFQNDSAAPWKNFDPTLMDSSREMIYIAMIN